MIADREKLKQDILSLVFNFNEDGTHPPDIAVITDLIDTLAPLSPIPDPTKHLAAVAGSWSNLYASFGAGLSKGKSHQDDSTLALQTFKAFPGNPIHVTDIVQEIGEHSNFYNNVIFFQTMDGELDGIIIVHGVYECDPEDVTRFRVIFQSAEIRGTSSVTDADLRRSFGFPDDYSLRRDFKPARFHSDVVYLDENIRINKGGMGGLYVLERRSEPAISV